MILKKVSGKAPHINDHRVVRRFAILPTKVVYQPSGEYVVVWLRHYYQRQWYGTTQWWNNHEPEGRFITSDLQYDYKNDRSTLEDRMVKTYRKAGIKI